MITALLLAVFLGTAAAVILIIYLIDRVNRLEKIAIARDDKADSKSGGSSGDSSFLGLNSKALWDAMCGKPPEGFNSNDLVALKPRYEHVLIKHIESIFAMGVADGQAGTAKKPKATTVISTLRGSIESWLPPQHVSTIYNVAFESVTASTEDMPRLINSLDESGSLLFSRTDLTLKQSLSSVLLPQQEEELEQPALEDNGEANPEDEEILL
jgi:hypothetical protein